MLVCEFFLNPLSGSKKYSGNPRQNLNNRQTDSTLVDKYYFTLNFKRRLMLLKISIIDILYTIIEGRSV